MEPVALTESKTETIEWPIHPSRVRMSPHSSGRVPVGEGAQPDKPLKLPAARFSCAGRLVRHEWW